MSRLAKKNSNQPFGAKTSRRTQHRLEKLAKRQLEKAEKIQLKYGQARKRLRYVKSLATYAHLDTGDGPLYKSWLRQKEIRPDKSGPNRLIHEKARLNGTTAKYLQGRVEGQGDDAPIAFVRRIEKKRDGKTIVSNYDDNLALSSKDTTRSYGRFVENWDRDTNGKLIRTNFSSSRKRDGAIGRRKWETLSGLENGKRTQQIGRGLSYDMHERDEATGEYTLVGRKRTFSQFDRAMNADGSVQNETLSRFGRSTKSSTYLTETNDPATQQPNPLMKTVKKTRFGLQSIRTVPLTAEEIEAQQLLRESKQKNSAEKGPGVPDRDVSLPTNSVPEADVSQGVQPQLGPNSQSAREINLLPITRAPPPVMPRQETGINADAPSQPQPPLVTPQAANQDRFDARSSAAANVVSPTGPIHRTAGEIPVSTSTTAAGPSALQALGGSVRATPGPSFVPRNVQTPEQSTPSTRTGPATIHRLNAGRESESVMSSTPPALHFLMESVAASSTSTNRSTVDASRPVGQQSSLAPSAGGLSATPASSSSSNSPTGSIRRLGVRGTTTAGSLQHEEGNASLDASASRDGETSPTTDIPQSRFANRVFGASTYATTRRNFEREDSRSR